jgi:hypothetical protein
VVTKTLAFHTSVSYEFRAPQPFTSDVHEDVLGDLARIGRTQYASEFDMHVDLSRSVKRLMDGHCVYSNACFDSLFLTFVPLPLVLLTDARGNQAVHIAPEAFTVASAEFADEVSFWQDALPGKLKGELASVSLLRLVTCELKLRTYHISSSCQVLGSSPSTGKIRSLQSMPTR